MHLSSGCQEKKNVEINLTAYRLMVEESLFVLHFKAFFKNKRSRSDMQYHTCIKKTV